MSIHQLDSIALEGGVGCSELVQHISMQVIEEAIGEN